MISFSIAVGFNRKSRTATFISILRTNDSISIQKLFVHGKMAVIFLGNCGLPALPFHCFSHQPTSPADTAQLEHHKPEPPHHGKGGGNTAPCCLTKGSPKFPLSTAAVFHGPIRGLDSMLLLEKLHFLSAKSPVFPSQVWMSPLVQLMLRQGISIAYRAGISSPLVHTQGQREQNVKLFAIVYWKSANKVTLEWDRIPSSLAFCQPPSKYVPWHECLLRK